MQNKQMYLYVLIVLLLLLVFLQKTESYTVEERVKILEKRVNDLYSGGADARHQPVFSSSNQN